MGVTLSLSVPPYLRMKYITLGVSHKVSDFLPLLVSKLVSKSTLMLSLATTPVV